MLTIKIIIWICKSEIGGPCEPLWLFLWKQFPWHLRSTFSIPVWRFASFTHSNPHFPNTRFRPATFSSFFYSAIELDITGMMHPAGHCAPLLTQRNEGNEVAVSTGPLSAFAFLVQLARLKISPNYVLEVWLLSSLGEAHAWITMGTGIWRNFHPEATALLFPSSALWQLHPPHKGNHFCERQQLLNSTCSQATPHLSPETG